MGQIFDFGYRRSYHGAVQAVIFDWAGTIAQTTREDHPIDIEH